MGMSIKPLSDRELKRLAKVDCNLARGRIRFGLFGAIVGFLGGLGWVVIMWMIAPGFATNMRLAPPTGHEAHALLEQIFYWLAVHFGPVIAICLLAGGLFGAMFCAFSFGLAWRLMVRNHADLAVRAAAFGQFEPRFSSADLRRRLAR
jgi:hypothetical protein